MPPDIRGIAPLLQVFDMPTSVRFYCDIIGFELVNTSSEGEHFDWALLRRGNVELMLNTAYESHKRPPSPDPRRIAGHADIELYFGCPDVDEAYKQLHAKGLPVKEPIIRDYGMKQLYIDDPDGYRLCFQWHV